MTADEKLDQIAHRITGELFINGNGETADRLVLMDDTKKRDLGGWCYEAVKGRVLKYLGEAFPGFTLADVAGMIGETVKGSLGECLQMLTDNREIAKSFAVQHQGIRIPLVGGETLELGEIKIEVKL